MLVLWEHLQMMSPMFRPFSHTHTHTPLHLHPGHLFLPIQMYGPGHDSSLNPRHPHPLSADIISERSRFPKRVITRTVSAKYDSICGASGLRLHLVANVNGCVADPDDTPQHAPPRRGHRSRWPWRGGTVVVIRTYWWQWGHLAEV